MAFLQGMAAWMAVNGEAIFATRPWKLYGEGAVKSNGGPTMKRVRPFTAKDFRFTTKGNVLYATALGWPDDGKLTVRVLASNRAGDCRQGQKRFAARLAGETGVRADRRRPGRDIARAEAVRPCLRPQNRRAGFSRVPAGCAAFARHPCRGGRHVHAAAGCRRHHRGSAGAGRGIPNIGYWNNAKTPLPGMSISIRPEPIP